MYTFVCVFVEMICITLQVKTPHVTGVGHTKALLNEVKDQVILGTYIYIYCSDIAAIWRSKTLSRCQAPKSEVRGVANSNQ